MYRLIHFTMGMILLLITVGTSKGLVLETAQPPLHRSSPPMADGFTAIPNRFDLVNHELKPRANETVDALLPWTRVAFSAYQENSWEIFIAQDDGSSERRLTNHSAADTMPALDRGCQNLVFTSNRDGDDDIYIMKTDGSGLRKLTSNDVDDFNPSWSPDGSQIAFQSYRNGQSEIYVMRADGSRQTRLTTSEAYDGMPNWSPDGQKIAFVSTRRDGYRIWVMDVDGGNPSQLSNQALSENPIWSPDGSQIAYDADGNDDSWQELWLMDANGNNQHRIYDPGYPYDAWAGSWSPDGQHIAFSRAEWRLYDGDWYWVASELYRWRVPYGGSAPMQSGNNKVNPNWQTMDAAPPTSSVNTLPAYLRNDAEVFWTGIDRGEADINHFDIQYKLNDNVNWTDWQTNAPPNGNNMAIFPHQLGDTIYFRSRAVDNAFNREAWPDGDGDTATTFYSWAISGMAHDNRNTPLEGVTATGAQAFDIWPSNAAGVYRSYYAGYDHAFTNTWDKSGYLDLPATSFIANQDIQRNVILPPIDNVIQDWGFETGQLPSAAWSAGGAVHPAISDTEQHTGDYAAFLGIPFGLDPPTSLHSGAITNFKPRIASDESGSLHALWVTGNNQANEIVYNHRALGENWSVPQAIASNAGSVQAHHWGVSDTGRVHVIWVTSTYTHDILYHAWRDESGTWSTPRLVYGQGRISPRRLVIDNGGDAHLVWRLEQTSIDDYYYAHTDQNGNWSSPSRIGATGEYHVDDFAIGSDNKVHLLWRYSGDDILYSYRLPDGTWSTRELVFPGGYNWYFRIVVNSYDQVHIVWSNVSIGKLYHRMRAPGGSWSPVKILSENRDFSENEMQVVAAADGTAHIVWPGGDEGNNCLGLIYAKIDRFGRWTDPVSVPMGDHCVYKLWLNMNNVTPFAISHSNASLCLVGLDPTSQNKARCVSSIFANQQIDVAAKSQDLVHIIWQENDNVMFTETARVQETGASIITQEVVVPDVSSHPTLSFIYLLDGAGEDGGDLEVSVADSMTTTSLYSTSETTTDWTHQWLDLSPWSGQNITLTVQVHQVVGAPHTSAFVDEVTLGTSYPDTWVAVKAPNGTEPGGTMDLIIDYGNRGGVSAEAGQLALTLPAEISFVNAQPAPTTVTPILSWDLGELLSGDEGSIVVTGKMAPEANFGDLVTILADLTSSTTELELFNNEFEQTMQVGLLMYLPAVQGN